jgi:hypothetical protein
VVYHARYWREQAVLCTEIAWQISDRYAADKMRATATEYFARAAALEKRADAADPDSDTLSPGSPQPNQQ